MHTHRSTEGSHRLTHAFFLSLLFSSPDIFWCTDHPLSEFSEGQPPLHFDLEGSYDGQSSYHTLLINLTLLFSSRLFSFSSFFLGFVSNYVFMHTNTDQHIPQKLSLFILYNCDRKGSDAVCVALVVCPCVYLCAAYARRS